GCAAPTRGRESPLSTEKSRACYGYSSGATGVSPVQQFGGPFDFAQGRLEGTPGSPFFGCYNPLHASPAASCASCSHRPSAGRAAAGRTRPIFAGSTV